MSDIFKGYYGRYVDDFYVLAESKEEITKRIKSIENYLFNNYGLILHKKKRYIQRYDKGIKFIGTTIKKDKIRLGNECLGNLYSAIHKFNLMEPTPEIAEQFVQTLNSYFGFLRHGDNEWKRKKLWNMIFPLKWRKSHILWINKDYTVIKVNPKYTRKYKQKLNKNINYNNWFEEDFW